MEMEQSRIPATEVEWERVSVMVRGAYEAWSQDSANPETIQRMNQALDEAYGTGVRIAVKVTQQARESSDVFNPIIREFQKYDSRLNDEIVIDSIQEISPRKYRGKVVMQNEMGYLSLELYLVRLNYRIPFVLLKPEEIALFTPIEPTQ